jgi:ABC-type uncharacterized transport system substrate-binding protein
VKKLLILSLLYIYSFAHPHTFIELHPTFKKDGENIIMNIKWHFDEMTSSMFMMDFDSNGDGKFDKQEKEIIYQDGFSHLDEFSYYTFIKIKNSKLSTKITNFDVDFKNNKIVYSFDVLLDKNSFNSAKFDFYDQELYMAFILKDEFISNNTDRNLKITKIEDANYFGFSLN